MVRISALRPYCPKNPIEFTTNPYDVIGKVEEKELKQNVNSLIHLILPDGEGEEIYNKALNAYTNFKASNLISREEKPSIFVYRQESPHFSQEGLIMGIALQDYEENNIVKHEYTRVKPLKDRTKHITTSNVAAGLVWSVFRHDIEINKVIEQIKQKKPKFDFNKYGYRHILWQETELNIMTRLSLLFKDKKVYIADGHHRAASAAEYRKIKMEENNESENFNSPWQFLLSYVASDDQIRILPYNRVIKRLKDGKEDFLEKLEEIYYIEKVKTAFNPNRKNQAALCIRGRWYKLETKEKTFDSIRDSLDVAILQDKVLGPILKIINIRADDNIFFVGGLQDPNDMEKYTTDIGNDAFFNLYPVDIKDLESIADSGGVMPPKSTWFDPKLLSGLVLHDLSEE
ncbi:MAG: DUF1015 domain-containing protein [Candidatus Lokiarchaeota archaeon]|nr:DUF1015 domain-containing protein [Candidatus Lokiarchaeota archaeon]